MTRMKPIRKWLLLAGLLFTLGPIRAQELATAPYLCDSMVLQCGMPLPLEGTARPGSRVEVSFAGHEAAATADEQGRWTVLFPALDASEQNRTMEIRSGGERLEIRDILVGEVWLAGGQSNMAFKVRGMEFDDRLDLIRDADYPAVRCYYRANVVSGGKLLHTTDRPWSAAYGRRIYDWSAVAYLFARELHRTLGVPVGIVNCSHGGSTAEAWISPAAYAADPGLEAAVGKRYDRIDSLYKNPSVLCEKMLARFRGLTLRGVIWYQGESNGYFPERYATLFTGLIADWRRFFANDELPFVFAQLPSYRVAWDKSGERWAQLRQAQLDVARTTARTALVVTSDCGDPDDIHPKNKRPVGERFAAAALHLVYGDRAPGWLMPAGAVVRGGKVRIPVEGIRNGLTLRGASSGIELRAADGTWHAADLRIRGNVLEASAEEVSAPRAVRYAWGNLNTLTIYHRSGLPLPPFTFELNDENSRP